MKIPDQFPRRALAAITVLGLSLAACGDGDEAEAVPESDPGEESATTVGDVVDVGLVDYAFVGLPTSVPAGTRLTVTNEAEAELHELVAFNLPEDEDRAVAELTELAPDELVAALGEPAAVLLAEPGGEQIPAVGDGTLSEPGRYAIMCFIPTGVDPQEYLRVAAETEQGPPQVEGGPPHFVQGMYAELTVE